MTDSYYELIDDADPLGEKFRATDLARGTWSAAIQHGGPVSALLVRALERCAQRDDTRLGRVVIDLLGGVPAEGDLWVRSQLQRGGKQIELVSAEMLAPGPDGSPGRWRAPADGGCSSSTPQALAHAAPRLPRPRTEARSRNLKARQLGPQLRAQPGLAVADRTAERGPGRILDQADRGPRQRARR